MFNSGIRGRRAKDNEGLTSPQAKFVQTTEPQPSITGYTISGTDDTALDTAGGQTVLVNGSGFATGISATLGGTQIGSVTLINSTQISFTTPAKAGGSYSLVVYNSTGGAAILVPGLTYSSVPTYTTNAGSIGNYYETTAISSSVTATSDSSVTYTLASGSLPSGATLNNDGTITGTSPVDSSSTTYTFAIKATDTELQDVTRTFTLTINTDVVSWSSPSDGATYSLVGGTPMGDITLSASSAAGYNVSYTANALPTGITLSGNTISGTPTVAESVTTLLTASAATTNRTATRTISWLVVLGDSFWKNVTLLLNGDTPTTPFTNDASLNNSQLTIQGDTRPTNFNPYQRGYYSYYYPANGSYHTLTNSIFNISSASTVWSLEMWVLPMTSGYLFCIGSGSSYGNGIAVDWGLQNTNKFTFMQGNGSSNINNITTTNTFLANKWYHFAVTKDSSGVIRMFVNGVQENTVTNTTNAVSSGTTVVINGAYDNNGLGNYGGQRYISNLRFVKDTAIYTSNFTPSTTPLLSSSVNSLLTCLTNKFEDTSNNQFSLTLGGSPAVSSAHPFATVYQAGTQYYSTKFDGTGDYITSTSNVAITTGAFTIEFWMYPMAVGSLKALVANTYWNVGNNGGYRINITSSNNIRLEASAGVWNTYPTVITSTTALSANTWYHIAIVRNSSDQVNIYINGVVSATPVTYTNSLNLGSGQTFMLGGVIADGGLYDAFNGYISNLRIVNGTAVYTSAFTPPTSPLTAVTNTIMLTCNDAKIIDGSTNNYTFVVNGDTKPITVSPFISSSYTNTQITTYGSGYFDGTGDYLTSSANPAFAFGATNDFTAECWVYFTTLNANQSPGIISVANSGSSTGWQIYADSNNGWGVRSNAANVFSTTNPPKINQWYHVAYVRKSGVHALYVNGVLNAPTSSTSYTWSDQVFYTGYTPIGQNVYGYIADVRLVNGTALYSSNFVPQFSSPLTAVTNTQLLTLQYNGGTNNNNVVDQSSFNNLITRGNNITQGTFSPYSPTGWSVYFNGSTDYINTSSSFNTSLPGLAGNKVQIEMWVLHTAVSRTYEMGLIGTYAAVAANGRWYFGINSDNTLTFVYTTGTGSQSKASSTDAVPLNQWTHVAVTVDATTSSSATIKFYVNGVASTTSTGNNLSTHATNYGPPQLPVNSSYVTLYTGYMSNVRVIKNNFTITGSFTPSTTPLIANQDTILLIFQNNRLDDNSGSNVDMTTAGAPSVQAHNPFGGTSITPTSYSTFFDGSSDYLTITGNNVMNFTSTDWTVEAWVYLRVMPTSDAWPTSWSSHFILVETGTTGAGDGFSCIIGQTKLLCQSNDSQFAGTVHGMVINTWYHVAYTRSSNTIYFYVNGVAKGSVAFSGSVGTGANTYIGSETGEGAYFNGFISNLRVVKGTSLYSSSFTPSTSPLTAISGTSLLTCQSSTTIDNSSNNFAISSTGQAQPKSFNPFGQTTTSIVTYSPALHGGSMYFDGVDDYLSLPSSTQYNLIGDFTIEAWVYPTATMGSSWGIFDARVNGATAAPYAIGMANSSGYKLELWTGTTYRGTKTINLNEWTHVVWTRNGSYLRSYVNGVSDYDNPNFGTSDISPGTTSPYVNTKDLGISGYDTQGYIADFRFTRGVCLYKANFEPSRIPLGSSTILGTTIYPSTFLLSGTNGGIINYHSTTNFETVGNTQLAPQDPYGGSYYSNYFSTSGLSLQNNSGLQFGTGDFTLELWMWPIDNVTSDIIEIQDRTTAGSWALVYQNSVIKWQSRWGNTDVVTSGSYLIRLSSWNHIAVVRISGVTKIYLNGAEVGSASDTTNYAPSTSFTVTIGGSASAYYNNFYGYMSNIRVVKGVGVYSSAFIPPTVPLTVISGTSLLTCQSNKFVDNSTNNSTFSFAPLGYPVLVKSMNPFQQNTRKSLYFDGSGDYLSAPSNIGYYFGTGDFTIEFWMYVTTAWTSNNGPGIGQKLGDSYGGWVIYRNTTVNTDKISLRLAGPSGASNIDYPTTVTPVSNIWQHWAVVRSGTTLTWYCNGVACGVTTGVSTNVMDTAASALMLVGRAQTWSTDFTGYLAEIRVTKGVARYTTTFTPPSSPVFKK